MKKFLTVGLITITTLSSLTGTVSLVNATSINKKNTETTLVKNNVSDKLDKVFLYGIDAVLWGLITPPEAQMIFANNLNHRNEITPKTNKVQILVNDSIDLSDLELSWYRANGMGPDGFLRGARYIGPSNISGVKIAEFDTTNFFNPEIGGNTVDATISFSINSPQYYGTYAQTYVGQND